MFGAEAGSMAAGRGSLRHFRWRLVELPRVAGNDENELQVAQIDLSEDDI
jgi:hypothetical protein